MNLDWGWLHRNLSEIASLLGQHALLAMLPVLASLVIALPLGYLVFRAGRASNAIVAVLGVICSIPALALLVALPVLLGTTILDPINVGVALTIYSVALLVRSVVDGLRSVPTSVTQAASAAGFGGYRRLLRVELPLAMPRIFVGLRVVTVSNIALVSVAALVGIGGLGQLFRQGYDSQFYTPLVAGLVLSVALALVADGIISLVKRGDLALGVRAAYSVNVFRYLFDSQHWVGGGIIVDLLGQHLAYTGAAVAIAALVAIPLGILIGRTGRGAALVTGLSSGVRALPTLGLLFLAVLLLGVGAANIVTVLAVLALPPILSATAAGISGADQEAVRSARALGMSEGQIVGKVEGPLALPLVISGLRKATLQVVGTATLAAFTSGGGLGRLITGGQAQGDYPQMLAGAIVIAALAVVLHLVFGGIGVIAGRRLHPQRWTGASAPGADPSVAVVG